MSNPAKQNAEIRNFKAVIATYNVTLLDFAGSAAIKILPGFVGGKARYSFIFIISLVKEL